jgi:hypothetical protein
VKRAHLELVALANRWPWLDAPALSLPGGTVDLARLRPLELALGIRTTVNGRQINLSSGAEIAAIEAADHPSPFTSTAISAAQELR